MIASKTVLNLLHFNDVYRVTKQRVDGGEIDVSQWARMLDERRREWPVRPDGKPDGLLLFSGDAFSPSVESSVTRGSHMVCLTALQELWISDYFKGTGHECAQNRLRSGRQPRL